jgi:UDP-GlcNAc:undecaprenyl-phosphate GlcNAc-1-phosphate transferase
MSEPIQVAGALAVVMLATWIVPAVSVAALAPLLGRSSWVRPNYRGRAVFLGLGVVWAPWTLGVLLLPLAASVSQPLETLDLGNKLQVVPILVVFAFGLVDDLLGSGEHRGFGGHLRSLVKGHITTGTLKLAGIGLAAVWASLVLAKATGERWSSAEGMARIAAGALLIAGAANLLNLLDLRPGRALKGYLFLVVLACGTMLAVGLVDVRSHSGVWLNVVLVAIALVGPVVAVWRYDLSERGMLGDAGANPAGAVIGVVLASTLPLWAIILSALVVLALNLISERVSFSQVIAANEVLSWFDGLGRARDDVAGTTRVSG